MSITIGLDFGTHQTKVCIEDSKDKYNPHYKFMSFTDLKGNRHIMLPSIIQVNKDNTLSYGFVDEKECQIGKVYKKVPKPIDNYESKININIPPKPKMGKLPIKPVLHEDDTKSLKNLSNLIRNKQELCAWENECKRINDEYNKKNLLWIKKWEEPLLDKKRRAENLRKIDEERWQKYNSEKKMYYRYFKQYTFYPNEKWNFEICPDFLSIWFLSYIIFLIEEEFGNNISIQMGVSSGSYEVKKNKEKAVSLLLSAYNLVENVFNSNKKKFLSSTLSELLTVTKIMPFSQEEKEANSILVFPESFASLRTIAYNEKICGGMNLLVDIGGGTTDISFFTVFNKKPHIYDYVSVPYGLNHIIEESTDNIEINYFDALKLDIEFSKDAIEGYFTQLRRVCNNILCRLDKEYLTGRSSSNGLYKALENRIILYNGGGATFNCLNEKPAERYFTDVKCMNINYWDTLNIDEISNIVSMCPILANAYGLSIASPDAKDDILQENFKDLFSNIPKDKYENENKQDHGCGNDYGLSDVG